VRLTIAFAVAMALVLGAVAVFLYVRLGKTLADQLDDSLVARSTAIAPVVRDRGGVDQQLTSGDDEGFAQLLRPDGSIAAASGPVGSTPLLGRAELERAANDSFFLRREALPGLDDEPYRLFAAPAGDFVLVVGASLEDREEALDGLLTELVVAIPLALLAASAAGYALASAALRPVEAMRRRAAEISSDRLAQRLPLPAARDEIARLGETLNDMLARLEAGLERERRFVADASHELRTPLSLLRTELELALRRPRSRAQLEAALRSAADEAERLSRLAEDLLVLARADEGRLPLRIEQVASGELLEAVARRFAARAADEGRSLEVTGSPEVQSLGDRLRLEQALGNLVDNALRHGAGTVRLEAERADGLVEFRVSDEGPGFPAEFLPRAFDRFARADEARSGAASGLGLAIVEAVARAHGGTARAVNGSRSGAVVILALPTDRGETTG
jgi:two-component system OmpR family sensor kinase